MKKIIVIAAVALFIATGAFAGILPFVPKIFNDLPDSYGVKITYITGKEESFELASHVLNKDLGIFEFATKDDVWNWVPVSSVQRIEFDKRFSKIMSVKEKESAKQADGQKK